MYLYFSVNGSGHFCGMAEMTSAVDMSASVSVWSQDKWRGQFTVKWIYVKDVPNAALRHIRLENNENKPVTNSRDTQEVLPEKGRQVCTAFVLWLMLDIFRLFVCSALSQLIERLFIHGFPLSSVLEPDSFSSFSKRIVSYHSHHHILER